jgi:hypothetical protein
MLAPISVSTSALPSAVTRSGSHVSSLYTGAHRRIGCSVIEMQAGIETSNSHFMHVNTLHP